MIKQVSLVPYNRPDIGKEELEAVDQVMKSGFITQGKEVELFEKEIAQYIGCKEVICVSSGTMAMNLAYLYVIAEMKIDLEKIKVYCPATTFIASILPAFTMGLNCEFVDVDRETSLMMIEENGIEKKLGKDGILSLVHLAGNIKHINFYHPNIIEDGCQSFGSILGGRLLGENSRLCVFSFHTGKIITSGEGGCIVTNNKDVADRIRDMRNHGQIASYVSWYKGLNGRMTNISASIGCVQLKKIRRYIEYRRGLYNHYRSLLKSIEDIKYLSSPSDCHPIYSLFPIFTKRAKSLKDFLRTKAIEYRTFFPSMINQKVFDYKYDKKKFKNSIELEETGILLPFGNSITYEEVEYVVASIKEFYNG